MAYQELARRLKFLIRSSMRHGAGHVAEVFRQERRRRRYAAAPAREPTPHELNEALANGRDPAAFIEGFHRSAAERLLFTRSERAVRFNARPGFIEAVQESVASAAHIAAGRFEGLGLCISEHDGRFAWHRDYGSGKEWPRVRFDAIEFMQGDGSDVKYPWELSRMYWIGWLALASWTTGDRAWSDTFVRMIEDWRGENPINVGVNWAMPMEVAIRAFWLVMGYAAFAGTPEISEDWWAGYLSFAAGHGRYLADNLEYFSNLTNHYISNCLGLVALGTLFAAGAEGTQWLEEGRRRLVAELDHQVLADGVHYERSICYHRLVTEMYLIALLLLDRAGTPFAAGDRARIERMAEFMLDYTPPHGTVPQFGDSDDGVILRLAMTQELYDHRDTLGLAGAIFDRADMRAAAGTPGPAALMMLDDGPLESLERPGGTRPPASRLYRDGGFAVLRSPRLHVMADVGEIGLHGNNDTLAFTVHGAGGAFIIDPGTYCYTRSRKRRDQLRSTAAHNTPCIDGAEIAEFDGLWRIKRDRTRVRINLWHHDTRHTVLDAEHHAYSGLAAGRVTVRRRWELAGDVLRVSDRFLARGHHRARIRFTIPHDATVSRAGERTVVITRAGGERMEIEFNTKPALREGWYSPHYGVAAPATWIELDGAWTASEQATEFVYICRLLSHD